MGRYVLRRLLLAVPVLIGSTFLIYFMVYAIPGDPIRALGGDRPISPAVQAQLRLQYNLDDPFLVQYVKYVGDLLQGNFGTDFSGRPVLDTISQRLPTTAKLTAVAIVIEAVIGVIAGILAGIRRGSYVDNLVLVSTTFVVSIPIFVLAFVLQYFLGVQLGLFPVAGIQEGFYSYILPGFVLASTSLAYVARLTRTSIAENMRGDYVRTARAKGLKESRVIGKHTLRNSMIPVVTFVGADIGALLGGAIVTEAVFNIPGLGQATIQAVERQEGAVVVGIVTLLVFFYIFFNLAVDIAYAALDPRIRYD